MTGSREGAKSMNLGLPFNRLRYFCSDAWDEWCHSKTVNLLALTTLATALFVAGLILLVIGNVDRRIERLRNDVHVEIYLEDAHTPEQREELATKLRGTDGVAAVEFVDKDEALRRYRTWAAGQAELVDELGSNPLPASLEVQLTPGTARTERAAAITRSFDRAPGVEEIRFGYDWLERLESMLRVARTGGGSLSLLVLAAVVFVMAAVLRLAVYARREEIDTMRLVGATPGFIRGPFLVAGAVQGLIAAGLALGLVELVRRTALGSAGTTSTALLDLLASQPLSRTLSGVLLAVGLFASVAGSYFAVRENP
jgi:cell division transport system permease protein